MIRWLQNGALCKPAILEADFNSIGIMLIIKSGLRSALRSIVDEAIEAGDRLGSLSGRLFTREVEAIE
jgi:hypothetical protein